MEEYREIFLSLSSVLKWEKKFYPGVIFGAITFLFIILWYLSLSLLTLVGVIGLVAILIDYGYPIVSKIIFKPENWTGAQEKAYEEVVNEILAIKMKVCSVTKYACVPKEEKTIVVSGKNDFFSLFIFYVSFFCLPSPCIGHAKYFNTLGAISNVMRICDV